MRGFARAVTTVTIYSRPNCHLCEEMKAIVARVARSLPLAVEHVDISGNPELEGQYGSEVPVLVVDGRKAAKYRVTEDDLRRIVLGRAGAT
jgi:glutaredoxin